MKRKFCIGILILCFGLSSANTSLAAQVIESSPAIIQPYDLRDISQQMLAQDRVNRDQTLALRGFIDDNQKTTNAAMALQQEATLEKINQTMINYRDALLSRDRARIAANSQKASQYHDLIALAEDVDDIKGAGWTLQPQSQGIEEKYKISTDLRDEMMALNEKFKGEALYKNPEKINQPQEDRIRLLTQRLGEMDQKLAQLKDHLSRTQSENTAKDKTIKRQGLDLKAKDESVRWAHLVAAVAKTKAEYYEVTSQIDQLTMEQAQKEVRKVKDDFAQRLKNDDQFKNTIVSLKNQLGQLSTQLSLKEQQAGSLKSGLENKITEAKNQAQQEARAQQDLKSQLQDKENQIIATMKTATRSVKETQSQSDALRRQLADQQNKSDLLKKELDSKNAQSDQMTLMMSDYQKKLEAKDDAYNQELRQVLLARNNQARTEKQIVYLNAQLQEKEAQVVKIKKEMYDLQELMSVKDRDVQAQDLSLAVELASARQKLNGMPGSDELNSLKEGLKKATAQLKQKDEMLSRIKANADEYEKEFREQARGFQSLKDQLLNARRDIDRKNGDLKHKDKEIARLKDRSQNDPVRKRLKQALDKIDEQDRTIKALLQKLQDAGKHAEAARQ